MMRAKLVLLKAALATITHTEWAIIGIVVGMILIALGSGVNLLPLESLGKIVLYLTLCVAIAGVALRFLYQQYAPLEESAAEPTNDDEPEQQESQERIIPAMPEQPPTVGIPSGDTVDAVLKDIRDRLNADALDRKRAEEKEKQAAEAKARLLADEAIYYDERPKFIYFVKRGLWKALIAWLITGWILFLSLSAANREGKEPPVTFLVILLAVTIWFTIRCYGEWAWTRRQQKGNLVVVQQASNGWFGLYGQLYKISLLDCGNVVVGKAWYERVLRLSSGTVSIETPLDNKKPGESEGKVHDVFKNMRNMRDPERFQSLVLKRHDELTFGQPDVIRRSDQ